MITTEFLKDLEAFSLIIKKRITSKYSGSRSSVESGRGLSIKEYRPYTLGDDIRSIAWKLYARTDELFVKVFEEDRDLSVHVIVDATESMDYGRTFTKFSYASMVAAGFLYLAMRENERFRFSFMRDDIEIHPMRRGRNHFAAYVNEANEIAPDGNLSLAGAIERYLPLLKTKSLVIIVSDFLFESDDIERALTSLAKHDVNLIRVLDRDELELPFEGDFKMQDLESGDQVRAYISQGTRQQYLEKLEDHARQIEEVARSVGFDYATVSTADPIFDAFFEIIKRQ